MQNRVKTVSSVLLVVFGSLSFLGVLLWSSRAGAAMAVLQVPIGGRPVPAGPIQPCGAAPGGWQYDANAKTLRPPTGADAIGRAEVLRIAAPQGGCDQPHVLTLVATGPMPSVDAASVVFIPAESRVEARGREVRGTAIASGSGPQALVDRCFEPQADGGWERCTWRTASGLAADPALAGLVLLPAGARFGDDVVTFDAEGRRVEADALRIVPARVVIGRLLPNDASVDLASGRGEVPLAFAEAVAAVDCAPLVCEVSAGRLVVTSTRSFAQTVDVRFRLLPKVFVQRSGGLDAQPTSKLPLTYCPMAVASGAPVRGTASALMVVRVDGACIREGVDLRFTTGSGGVLPVLQTVAFGGGTFFVLKLGTVEADELTVIATRGADHASTAIASARTPTRPLPQVKAALELPAIPRLAFIPNNRPAVVRVARPSERERFEVVAVEGIYTTSKVGEAMAVQADANAVGFAALRFALRSDALPPPLRTLDLAVVNEPLQRELREANVAVALASATEGAAPLIELVCGKGEGARSVKPGETAHISFSLRDSCRIVFHRERLPVDVGTQKLKLEVEVITPDRTPRAGASLTETIRMRHGPEPRVAWVRGVAQPFDRVVVRVSHERDDAHYVGADDERSGAPGAQWSAVMGTSRARLYATSAIPAGLYRFGSEERSGTLSLNFGVISRLTWLDSDGHEGFLGLEGGIMVIGLANSTSATGRSLTEVGAVLGIGFAVPFVNRASRGQASVNLHAWIETPLSRGADGSPFALIVGPSITIGNVGANL
jgi:hypothetical protein